MTKWIVYLLLLVILSLSGINKFQHISNDLAPANIANLYSLISLDNWSIQSPKDCFFVRRITYENPGDKNMEYYPRLLDAKGNNHNISHPPFSLMLYYSIIKLLHLEISQMSLQWIHLFLSLIEILIVFAMIKLLLINKQHFILESALLGALIYATIPVVIYLHIFPSFSESLGQTLFLLSVYVLIRFYYMGRKTIDLIFVFICLFLFVYTDWLGILLWVCLVALMLLHRKFFSLKLLIFSALAAGLSLGLTLFQYISIAGLYEFLHSIGIRFIERSGWFASNLTDQGKNIISLSSYRNLISLFWELIKGTGSIAFILLIILKIKNIKIHHNWLLLYLILLPTVLSTIIFFNAVILHYSYWARFALFLTVAAALFTYKLLDYKKTSMNLILVVIFSLGTFWSILNLEKTPNITNKKRDHLVSIIDKAKTDEAIFINSELIEEINIYYFIYKSKRNIRIAENEKNIIDYCKEKNIKKAVFLTNNKSPQLKRIYF